MRAGALRSRISIQQVSESANTMGEVTKTWSEFASRRAEVNPLRGREFFQAQQLADEATVRFRIRYTSGIDSKMRIVYDNRTFDITAPPIDVENRHREMEIMAREVN